MTDYTTALDINDETEILALLRFDEYRKSKKPVLKKGTKRQLDEIKDDSKDWMCWTASCFPKSPDSNLFLNRYDMARLMDAIHIIPSRISTISEYPCFIWKKKTQTFRLMEKRYQCRALVYEYCFGKNSQSHGVCISQKCPKNKLCVQPYHLRISKQPESMPILDDSSLSRFKSKDNESQQLYTKEDDQISISSNIFIDQVPGSPG